MQIAIDLGFGYTKAVSSDNRVIFPSAVAPSDTNTIEGFNTIGHIIEFKKPGEIKKKTLSFGERAIKEGRAVELSLDNQKFTKEASAVLALAAAGLIGAKDSVDLAVGLPINTYKNKQYREDVIKTLKSVNAYVSIDGGPERYITFSNVFCFAQGVGAVYAIDNIPKNGLIGLIDIGFFTTDMVLFECNDGIITPLPTYFRSVNQGVSRALQLFLDNFTRQTGASITLINAMNVWKRKEVRYNGQEINIEDMVRDAKNYAARAITSSIREIWTEHIGMIDQILMAGGGAIELGDAIKNMLPQVQQINDPQFANAVGFYKMAQIAINKTKTA